MTPEEIAALVSQTVSQTIAAVQAASHQSSLLSTTAGAVGNVSGSSERTNSCRKIAWSVLKTLCPAKLDMDTMSGEEQRHGYAGSSPS